MRRLTATVCEIGRIVCERDAAAARARDERLLAAAGGVVRTVPRQDLIPPLEAGLLSPERHPANGTLFPQPRVRTVSGAALLDDLSGTGFRIVARSGECAGEARFDALRERLKARVITIADGTECTRSQRAGALCVVETDGVLSRWFERHNCSYAVVRPDHYVYGVAATFGDLMERLETLIASLNEPCASA